MVEVAVIIALLVSYISVMVAIKTSRDCERKLEEFKQWIDRQ